MNPLKLLAHARSKRAPKYIGHVARSTNRATTVLFNEDAVDGRLKADPLLRFAVENPRAVRHRGGRILWRIRQVP